jgi:thiamine-phosphate pyrophosphorylase
MRSESCLLYYITDRTTLAADEPTRRLLLLEKIREAAKAGIDYIQLREKDLPTHDLVRLAQEALKTIREVQELSMQELPRQELSTGHCPLATALLINSRTDVAMAAGASGVHLRSNDISPSDAIKIWMQPGPVAIGCGAGAPARVSLGIPVIGVSCHSPEETRRAAVNGATFAVFAPVFEKKDTQAAGLEKLHGACEAKIPVMALGGVTLENARSCLDAGAAGIAAIRMFQENDIATIVRSLRV